MGRFSLSAYLCGGAGEKQAVTLTAATTTAPVGGAIIAEFLGAVVRAISARATATIVFVNPEGATHTPAEKFRERNWWGGGPQIEDLSPDNTGHVVGRKLESIIWARGRPHRSSIPAPKVEQVIQGCGIFCGSWRSCRVLDEDFADPARETAGT
jgi:hypothetical protein